jgi:hypothetical protein
VNALIELLLAYADRADAVLDDDLADRQVITEDLIRQVRAVAAEMTS